MGCEDYPVFEDRYELLDVVAELWNPALARRFPRTDHQMCFQQMHADDHTPYAVPYNPPRCQDWHCPRCGEPTGMYGHRKCNAPTEPTTPGEQQQ